jgi:phosphoribosylformylglycinamidine synthase
MKPDKAKEERENIYEMQNPVYSATFKPEKTPEEVLNAENKHRVAIVREEGSNGDREMASAFYQAGFDVVDVTMSDILSGKIENLNEFRGLAFVGGFSYADTLGSAKG